jgi:hypothetical protein
VEVGEKKILRTAVETIILSAEPVGLCKFWEWKRQLTMGYGKDPTSPSWQNPSLQVTIGGHALISVHFFDPFVYYSENFTDDEITDLNARGANWLDNRTTIPGPTEPTSRVYSWKQTHNISSSGLQLAVDFADYYKDAKNPLTVQGVLVIPAGTTNGTHYVNQTITVPSQVAILGGYKKDVYSDNTVPIPRSYKTPTDRQNSTYKAELQYLNLQFSTGSTGALIEGLTFGTGGTVTLGNVNPVMQYNTFNGNLSFNNNYSVIEGNKISGTVTINGGAPVIRSDSDQNTIGGAVTITNSRVKISGITIGGGVTINGGSPIIEEFGPVSGTSFKGFGGSLSITNNSTAVIRTNKPGAEINGNLTISGGSPIVQGVSRIIGDLTLDNTSASINADSIEGTGFIITGGSPVIKSRMTIQRPSFPTLPSLNQAPIIKGAVRLDNTDALIEGYNLQGEFPEEDDTPGRAVYITGGNPKLRHNNITGRGRSSLGSYSSAATVYMTGPGKPVFEHNNVYGGLANGKASKSYGFFFDYECKAVLSYNNIHGGQASGGDTVSTGVYQINNGTVKMDHNYIHSGSGASESRGAYVARGGNLYFDTNTIEVGGGGKKYGIIWYAQGSVRTINGNGFVNASTALLYRYVWNDSITDPGELYTIVWTAKNNKTGVLSIDKLGPQNGDR